MEGAFTFKEGAATSAFQQLEGQYPDVFKRSSDNSNVDGKRQDFSLDSLDKEIFQTMTRGGKNARVSPSSDSALEPLVKDMESAQEKTICSPESQHLEPVSFGYSSPEYKRHQHSVKPNGFASDTMSLSGSTSKIPEKIVQNQVGSGQLHAGSMPTWQGVHTRPNGSRRQIPRRDINGGENTQEPIDLQHLGGTLHRPSEDNGMYLAQLKDYPVRDVHSVQSKLDSGRPSDTIGENSMAETLTKQATQIPYPGGMFAYSGTPQRLFPGGQNHDTGSPSVGPFSVGIPNYDRANMTHNTAQTSGGRSQQRPAIKSTPPKVPPSKWDDADKWIASPSHNDSPTTSSNRSNQGKRHTIAGQGLRGYYGLGSPDFGTSSRESPSSPKSNGNIAVVHVKEKIQHMETLIQKASPVHNLTKRLEVARAAAKSVECGDSPSRLESDDQKGHSSEISTVFAHLTKDSRLDAGLAPTYKPPNDPKVAGKPVSDCPAEEPQPPDTPSRAPIKDIFSNGVHSRMSSCASPTPTRDSFPDVAKPSSTHRDMGTQMTPNPSVRRGATPGIDISPSRHNTPDRSNRRAASVGSPVNVGVLELQSYHLEKLGHRTLGFRPRSPLNRNATWSTREEEEEESAICLRIHDYYAEAQTGALAAWAIAWEEAESARYTARYYQEEAKIQAWEERQKLKAEAEMKKTEMKLEKMRVSASEKMSHKIAVARRKAEDLRAAAAAARDEHAAKARQRAEQIQQTSDVPASVGCFAAFFV